MVRKVGGCSPQTAGQGAYILLVVLMSLIPLSIVIVTTLWTFIYTRNFLKKTMERQTSGIQSCDKLSIQQSIYSKKVKNLVGIFGALLLSYLISWPLYLISSIAVIVVGVKNFPSETYAVTIVIFLLQNTMAPLIQIYFRQDLLDSLRAILRALNCYKSKKRTLSGTGSSSSSNMKEDQKKRRNKEV